MLAGERGSSSAPRQSSDVRSSRESLASKEAEMATERLVMRNVKEILRAKWELGLSNRQTANSARVSPASVVNVVRRAR